MKKFSSANWFTSLIHVFEFMDEILNHFFAKLIVFKCLNKAEVVRAGLVLSSQFWTLFEVVTPGAPSWNF
jgi:hypothetical protein